MKRLVVAFFTAALFFTLSVNMALAVKKVTVCHAAGQAGTTHFVTLEVPPNEGGYPQGHFTEGGTQAAGHEEDYLGPCQSSEPSPLPSTSSDPSPMASPTASPEPSPAPTSSPEPSDTPVPSPQPTPTSSASLTPSALPTPPATDTEPSTPTPTTIGIELLIAAQVALAGALVGDFIHQRRRRR